MAVMELSQDLNIKCSQLQKIPAVFMPIILTKTCRGKVMKEKLNCVKTESLHFIHHSSFCESLGFSPSYLTFGVAKGKVWCDET
jgi:hypothetical protein